MHACGKNSEQRRFYGHRRAGLDLSRARTPPTCPQTPLCLRSASHSSPRSRTHCPSRARAMAVRHTAASVLAVPRPDRVRTRRAPPPPPRPCLSRPPRRRRLQPLLLGGCAGVHSWVHDRQWLLRLRRFAGGVRRQTAETLGACICAHVMCVCVSRRPRVRLEGGSGVRDERLTCTGADGACAGIHGRART